MTRGRIGAYLVRYQLRDFLLLRALLPAMMPVFVCWMILATDGRGMEWTSPRGQRLLADMLQIVGGGMFIAVATFLGVARLVTDDRANGYFRFLFSKPVAIPRFYVQQWLLHGAVFTGLTGLLAAWLQALTTTLPVGDFMLLMALSWILIGGVGFFLTAWTNYDALLLLVVFMGTKILRAVKEAPDSPMWEWLRQATRLTPPTQKLTAIQDALLSGAPLPVPHAIHVAGYGLLAFAAGVVILRRGSFAR